jgi:hypothetical protein
MIGNTVYKCLARGLDLGHCDATTCPTYDQCKTRVTRMAGKQLPLTAHTDCRCGHPHASHGERCVWSWEDRDGFPFECECMEYLPPRPSASSAPEGQR